MFCEVVLAVVLADVMLFKAVFACFVTTWLHGGFSQCTVELLQMALSGYHSTIVHRIEYTCISKR